MFRELPLEFVELRKSYRQSDPTFLAILDAIRNGTVTQAELDVLNTRVTGPIQNGWVGLTARNATADRINDQMLSKLRGTPRLYNAGATGRFQRARDKNLPSPRNLKLKVGARVMFTRNDPCKRWLNGTLGTVKALHQDLVTVEITDHRLHATYNVERTTWELL